MILLIYYDFMENKITVNDFLIRELNKLCIDDFFGLPGDYNFDIISAVEKNPNTNWIGCTNELNAGYSADGYARAKGYGAVITTFGVGELGAIGAVAGSYSESVPVISIAGAPKTKHIKNNALIHHNFCKPDYYVFQNAYSNVVQKAVYLSEQNAKEEITEALNTFIKDKKPVYIAIPGDVGNIEIEDDSNLTYFKSDETQLFRAVKHALQLINNAKNPVIISGILASRFFAQKEALKFIKESNIPSTSLLMGKGTIDENLPNFIGTYLGSIDNKSVYRAVHDSDCVISIGAIYSDFNTMGNDININPKDFIEIRGNFCIIENETYPNIKMADVLTQLRIGTNKRQEAIVKSTAFMPDITTANPEDKLSFEYILPRFQDFLESDDRIISDTGILDFFVPSLKFPGNTDWFGQILWAAIGWATPATFGSMIANRDKTHILLTGEGSHQISIQSLSDMIRHDLKPIIIVLNNSGYTIERMISKDPCSPYNDIAMWDYTKIANAFSENIWSTKARTNREFDEALNTARKENKTKLCYIEIFTDKFDLPYLFKKMRERLDSFKK